ncbi:MAG: hypothetical protein QXT37_06390 [Thermofilaceae archaeon]
MKIYRLCIAIPAFLLLAIVLRFSALALSTQAQAMCEVARYLGNDIWVYGRDDIRVMAWFKPIVFDWESWKSCFYEYEDFYYQGLINRIAYMFRLSRALIWDYGIDDSERKVYVTLRFSLSESGFYNDELDSLTFQDIFKPQGGWIDEVHVYFSIPFHSVDPPPTSRGFNEVHWINPTYDQAPLRYTIYFSPIITIRVEVSGLPSGIGTQVYINKALKGKAALNQPLEVTVKKASYTVSVDPEISAGSGVKYVASQSSFTTSESAKLTFHYTKMVKVVLNTTVIIDGSPFSPGEHWLQAGMHTLRVDAPSRLVSSAERIAYSVDKWIISGKEYFGNPVDVNIDSNEKPVSIIVRLSEFKEFYVSIKGGDEDVEGWYREGTKIEANAADFKTVRTDVRDVFQGWYDGERLYSRSNRLVITVDKPINLQAKWIREYMVTVEDPLNAAVGGGWYSAGSTAEVRITREMIPLQENEVIIFKGWEGDISSRDPVIRFTVDSPKKLTVIWKKAFKVSFDPDINVEYSIDGCSFWSDGCWAEEGALITIRLSVSRVGFPVAYVLDGFSTTGLRQVWMDLRMGYLQGSVESPVYVRARWRTDYTALVIVIVAVTVVLGTFAFVYLTRVGKLHPPPQVATIFAKFLKLTSKGETQIIQATAETAAKTIVAEQEIKKLEAELSKYVEYLNKLEVMKASGQISDEIYDQLKNEYIKEIEKIKIKLENLKE